MPGQWVNVKYELESKIPKYNIYNVSALGEAMLSAAFIIAYAIAGIWTEDIPLVSKIAIKTVMMVFLCYIFIVYRKEYIGSIPCTVGLIRNGKLSAFDDLINMYKKIKDDLRRIYLAVPESDRIKIKTSLDYEVTHSRDVNFLGDVFFVVAISFLVNILASYFTSGQYPNQIKLSFYAISSIVALLIIMLPIKLIYNTRKSRQLALLACLRFIDYED